MSLAASAPPIRMQRVLRASPQTVFDALTQPEKLRHWMCPRDFTVSAVEADLRIGGRFRVEMRSPDGLLYPTAGTYLEIRAPELLAFTWTWQATHPLTGLETSVRVELTPQGADTRLVMTHHGLPTDEERLGHQEGWGGALAHLERLLG